MNIKWDGNNYKNNFNFVHEYGKGVMELIDFHEGMHILDLGCGNGALTKQFYDQGYDVIGLDASSNMLEIARKDYPECTFIQGDATCFQLEEKVDCIFSNAVFHWINNQDGLLDCIYNNLKDGGQLVCEFGGYRNAGSIYDELEKQFSQRGLQFVNTFFFPTIGQYTPLVEKHGILVEYAILFDRFTPLKGEDGLMNWLNMFMETAFKNVDEKTTLEIKEATVEALKEKLYKDGIWYVDYKRIRIKGVKYDR